jgi:hypothetical protein
MPVGINQKQKHRGRGRTTITSSSCGHRQIEHGGKTIRSAVFLAGVFLVPVLIDGAGHLCQPRPILGQFQNIRRGEKLDAVLCRVAERLERSGRDECRDVVMDRQSSVKMLPCFAE